MFQLPPGRDALAAVRNSAALLDFLLSRRPHSHEGERQWFQVSHCSLTYLSYHVACRTLTCQVCRSCVLGTLCVHVLCAF